MNKWIKWFKRRSSLNLANRLILYYILVIFFIVGATMGPTLYLFSDIMQKMNEDRALQGLEGLASIIEMVKQDALDHGSMLAVNPTLVSAIESKDTVQILGLLQPAVKKAKLDFATVTDGKGIVIARTHAPANNGDDLTNQSNIRRALLGEEVTGIESNSEMKFAIMIGIPVKNKQGEIVGVISAGHNLENNKAVDQVKMMFNTDATIFLGNVRLSTTIIKDGQRIAGTTLDEIIDQRVLRQGGKYIGQAEIVGEKYVTAYMPLIGIDEKPIGAIFAGQKVADSLAARNKLICTVTGVVLVAIILVIFLAVFMAKGIVTPIRKIARSAGLVAIGDLTQHVEITSRDEVGRMGHAFNHMVRQLNKLVAALNCELQERKQIEVMIRQSEKRYRLLAENVTDVIWTMDLSGRLTYISPSVQRLRGYTVEEALELTTEQWLTPSSAAIAMRDLQCLHDMIESGQKIESRRLELELRCKDGTVVWAESTCSVIYNADGEIYGIQGVDRNITEERQLERKIRKDVQLAGKLQKALLPGDANNELFIVRTAYAPLREVSGDFYNYLFHSDGILRGYVSDISGHGIATALNSAAVRFTLDEALGKKLTLELMQNVNAKFVEYLSDETFVALIMFEFDFYAKTVTLVTGGINHFLASTQQFNGLVTMPGGLIGLFDVADLNIVKMPIQPGDAFYFATDGLIDLIKGNMPDQVHDFEMSIDFLKEQIQEKPKLDDCSILCVKIQDLIN
ncbi:cache domain-containing protein [Pelosinus sp. IPA-1]|uniref:cache domain-containing protein n=1 Tax=Pelosinus sp. IPA-1 TaxID=3029569 RepID=UPI002553BC8F|nr:cache domain-containing protein [Pelosinus sp. IPA-1]